jgi:hypothetical protein
MHDERDQASTSMLHSDAVRARVATNGPRKQTEKPSFANAHHAKHGFANAIQHKY